MSIENHTDYTVETLNETTAEIKARLDATYKPMPFGPTRIKFLVLSKQTTQYTQDDLNEINIQLNPDGLTSLKHHQMALETTIKYKSDNLQKIKVDIEAERTLQRPSKPLYGFAWLQKIIIGINKFFGVYKQLENKIAERTTLEREINQCKDSLSSIENDISELESPIAKQKVQPEDIKELQTKIDAKIERLEATKKDLPRGKIYNASTTNSMIKEKNEEIDILKSQKEHLNVTAVYKEASHAIVEADKAKNNTPSEESSFNPNP